MKLIPLLTTLLIAMPLYAETVPSPAPTAAAAPMSDGMVRRIDPAAGKITLKHGPIVNLDMPPMTMVFRAQPPEILDGLKAGDAVRFDAELREGVYVVTRIERQP